MAPKRLKKTRTNEENGKKYENPSITDALCPICRSIIIEPVTLPCNHSFCLSCFDNTVENTTLTCPLCRTRIGSWLRSARKEKRLINTVFWANIQIKFPNEIRRRLNGEDVLDEDDNSQIKIKLADPGEIRREYEFQLEQERSVIQKERDTEEKASEIIIKKILQEEEEAARLAQEKLRLDEEVAKRLAATDNIQKQPVVTKQKSQNTKHKKSSIDKYLIALSKKKQVTENNKPEIKQKNNEATNSTSTSSGKSSDQSSEGAAKKTTTVKNYTSTIMCQSRHSQQKTIHKPLKHLLLTKTLQCERANSNDSDSGDSIKQEMRYFKPIRLAPSLDKYQDGQIVHIPLLKLPTVHAKTIATAVIRSPQINHTTAITTHPKSAFVCLSTSSVSLVQPSITKTNDSGTGTTSKTIKQYYNRKRNTLNLNVAPVNVVNVKQSCTITSKSESQSHSQSPLLGFEVQTETETETNRNHLKILNDFIMKLSQNINGVNNINVNVRQQQPQIPPKVVLNDTRSDNNKNLNGLNGYKPRKNEPNIQEQLDLEFAKRLHEELNNPRQTRASLTTTTNNIKTRSSPRKRQVTLEELITPKKFKI